jgi:putative transcriptional regulator
MTPNHHPADAILTDYVSGALRPAFAAVVAAHVEDCAHCRGQVKALEAVGGALIGELPATQMAAESLAKVMAALDETTATDLERPRKTTDRIPFGPERWLAPGMSIRKAKVGSGEDLLYVLRLPSGLKTIPHGHHGVEFTAVLTGAYDDGEGHFAAGDFCELDPAIEHQPQVTKGAECICLIASEKPMRMTSALGRIVHALTGV